MAVWQLRAWLIPERLAFSDGSQLAEAIREGKIAAWEGEEPGWCAKGAAGLGLAPAQSWDPETVMWGAEDGHYVRETTAGTQLLEAEIAIDARVINADYYRRLALFVNELKANLVTADGRGVARTEAEIVHAVRSSDAWRFVGDPERFLRALSKPSGAE